MFCIFFADFFTSLHQIFMLYLFVFSQLTQVKSFLRGQVYASATDSLTGQVSLEEFSRLMKQQEKTDELRQFGLSDEQISLKLKHDEMVHKQVLTIKIT